MRLGLFSNAYHPIISGVVNSLDEIRKGLLQRHHTPFLFAPEVKGHREQHAGVFRFPSVELDRSVEFPFPIPYSARVSRLVPRMGLDLIHSHHPILVGTAAANFARSERIPLVYTFHTQIEQYTHYVPFFKQQTVKQAARNKVSRYLAKCDLIICPSPSIRDLIESYGVSTPVVTLANAIDLKKFSNPPNPSVRLRDKLGLSEKTLLSLSVGRLAPEKGLPFLLQSFAQAREVPDHHLLMVGSGPQKEELQRLCHSLDIQDRVHFLGSVDYMDMPAIYAQCQLFVMCSTTEVKPLVVLEALASGLPTLAVWACGTKDTLQQDVDGQLCSLNIEEYSRSWRQLLEDESRRRRLSRGAKNTALQYSMETYMDRLCELYYQTIAEFRGDRLLKSSTA